MKFSELKEGQAFTLPENPKVIYVKYSHLLEAKYCYDKYVGLRLTYGSGKTDIGSIYFPNTNEECIPVDINISIEKEKELVFEDLLIGDRFIFKGVITPCIKSGDNEYRAENIYKISESDVKLPVRRI